MSVAPSPEEGTPDTKPSEQNAVGDSSTTMDTTAEAWSNVEDREFSLREARFEMRRSKSSSFSEPYAAIDTSCSMQSSASMATTQTIGGRLFKPSASIIDNLDTVLKGQFGELCAVEENDGESSQTLRRESIDNDVRSSICIPKQIIGANDRNGVQPARPSAYVSNELDHEHTSIITRIIEHKFFTIFFMTWTFYALFAVDIDLLCGSKQSKFALSIVTSAVVVLFLVEIVLQSIGRKNYFLRAYFWLDAVALLSLLPDTWFVQNMFAADNAFVAGRTSRLTRLIRIASRSSKATRLNRLTRIVRVASLMPRLGAFFGQRVKDDDTEKMLEKKLRRVFMYLDEDMDGLIPRSAVKKCLLKMKQDKKKEEGAKSLLKAFSKRVLSDKSSRSGELDRSGAESPSSPRTKPEDTSCLPGALNSTLSEVTSAASQKSDTPSSPKKTLHSRLKMSLSKLGRMAMADDFPTVEEDDTEMVAFKEFREMMMSDDVISVRLRRACQQQLKQGNNMKNLTSRHSEYIAVKVALGVLVLLFVLGLVEPDLQDKSAERGLTHITDLTMMKFTNYTIIPKLIHDQVAIWTQGVGVDPDKRVFFYLDLEKKVYCNEFVSGGLDCEPNRMAFINWNPRPSIKQIENQVQDSDYRLIDLLPIRVPDVSDNSDLSDDELDEQIESIAILYVRGDSQQEAVMSMLTTVLVIVIILSGIVLLTKDLTFLSRNLLKPLRELADDMESIAQLQLAGVSTTEESVVEEGTSEVRLIRRTFENMKKAIKSWGKYVPWPVVQLLLRANVEANLEVNEVEVTIFFSDIASFTTIVESMAPENSLLLLSRYFNDMSKVIDDHGGVVLEFIGDAILCIYGAPLMNPDHPTAAVKSTLRMLASLRRMNEWSVTRKLPEVKIRCGVHTGRVLVGNMGFHSRMKYGIVGEDAHVPSRLEEINKTYSTNMMISHATWEKLDTAALFITRPIDYVNLKQTWGTPSELIYQVMDRERKTNRAHLLWEPARLHREGMELYRTRDFKVALEKFKRVNQLMKDINGNEDCPSQLMADRCTSYIEQPPPTNWDGVWDRGNEE